MRLSASYDQARAGRVCYKIENKSDVWINTYIGTNIAKMHAAGHTGPWAPEDPARYPMAFLVEQSANATTQAHYHQADQFQLFAAGGGWFGGKPVQPLTLHFAAAYSPYGPIIAGPEGISYFTLRSSWDPGPRWMPENRLALREAKRQHRDLVSTPWMALSTSELASLPETSRVTLIEPAEDGLAAWAFRIPPHTSFTGPDPTLARGQYWLALTGSCVADGAPMHTLSCLFLSQDEAPLAVDTGSEGVELIAMQYPRHG